MDTIADVVLDVRSGATTVLTAPKHATSPLFRLCYILS